MTDVSIKTLNSNSKRGGERAFQIWGGVEIRSKDRDKQHKSAYVTPPW